MSWAVTVVIEVKEELIGFSTGLDKGQVREEGLQTSRSNWVDGGAIF